MSAFGLHRFCRPVDLTHLDHELAHALLDGGEGIQDRRCALFRSAGRVAAFGALDRKLLRLLVQIGDRIRNALRSVRGSCRERVDFLRHDREAAPRRAGPGGLYRGVERKQVDLLRDGLDALSEGADVVQGFGERGGELGAFHDCLAQFGDRREQLADDNRRSLNFTIGRPGGDVSLRYGFADIGGFILEQRRSLLDLRNEELLRRNSVRQLFHIAGDIHDVVRDRGRLLDESRDQLAVFVPPREMEEGVEHEWIRRELCLRA